ncbi:hypothetical protein D9619_006853 [Psilocybe cf. subviscida]|uniref:Uncharacterized protein n=1 Tax=Psilocybe cf. subviscida TaxID=2480587 RepID=A0A8H5EY55_9AGAR|nr:hypothetical protein D9619_006853 [Psilocybe cf. subviscida]
MASTEQIFTCIDHFCVSNEPATLYPPQPGAHILHINYRLQYVHNLPTETVRALDKRVHTRLAEIIARDKVADTAKRIDAIHSNAAGPTKAMWVMFADLNPRHLLLDGGFNETCRRKPLLTMRKWNRLESLYFCRICVLERPFHLPPFVLRTLRSLTIKACLNLDLCAVGGAEPMLRLEYLEIRVNDVGWSAARLLKNFPSIKKSLKRLYIDSLGYGYPTKRERTGIRRMLAECTRLTDVKLALLLHHSVGIAGFLPPSVQRLEFEGPCSMALLSLMDDWIAHAKDPKWAPELRYLELKVDREHRRLPMPAAFFQTELPEEEDSFNLTREEYMADLPPGMTVTWGDEDLWNHAQFDNDAGEVLDTGFDVDTDPVAAPDSDESDGDSEEEADDGHGAEVDEIDLDNLPDIGPHPTHVIRQMRPSGPVAGGEESSPPKEEKKGISEEALAEFDRAFQVKKQVLFDILRSSRPGIELV